MDTEAAARRIAAGRTDLVVPLLAADPAAHRRTVDGLALLGWCAYRGDVTAVRLLLAHGADRSGLGPNLDLIGAAFHGHEALVAWCLEEGADPSRREAATGETPLLAALCRANRPAHGRIVRALLAAGADVRAATVPGAALDSFMRDVRGRGETALHRAAAFADAETIAALLAAGADPAARDAQGDTPLSWASWHLRPDAVLRLLCHGPHAINPQRHGTYDHGTGWSHGELAG